MQEVQRGLRESLLRLYVWYSILLFFLIPLFVECINIKSPCLSPFLRLPSRKPLHHILAVSVPHLHCQKILLMHHWKDTTCPHGKTEPVRGSARASHSDADLSNHSVCLPHTLILVRQLEIDVVPSPACNLAKPWEIGWINQIALPCPVLFAY